MPIIKPSNSFFPMKKISPNLIRCAALKPPISMKSWLVCRPSQCIWTQRISRFVRINQYRQLGFSLNPLRVINSINLCIWWILNKIMGILMILTVVWRQMNSITTTFWAIINIAVALAIPQVVLPPQMKQLTFLTHTWSPKESKIGGSALPLIMWAGAASKMNKDSTRSWQTFSKCRDSGSNYKEINRRMIMNMKKLNQVIEPKIIKIEFQMTVIRLGKSFWCEMKPLG